MTDRDRFDVRARRLLARRDILRSTAMLGLAVVGAPALAACGKSTPKELKCDDTAGMSPAEIEQRKTLKYVDKTPDPAKPCNNCAQYVAAEKEGVCAKCKLFNNGPVNPNGNCTSWAAKPAT